MHVIGLCETFLRDENDKTVGIENYQSIHRCRSNKSGGGVSLLVHDSVRVNKICQTPFDTDFESVSVEILYKNKLFLMSEFYRPPNGDNRQFMLHFSELLKLTKRFHNCYLLSDQNYDLLKYSMHKCTNDFVNMIFDMEFVPIINKPTHITHSSSSLIDNIYVKSHPMHNFNSYILIDGMSDHFPCLVTHVIAEKGLRELDTVIEKRKLSEEAIQKINEFLLFYDWCLMNTLDVDQSYEFLISAVTAGLDKFAPKKLIRLKVDRSFMSLG